MIATLLLSLFCFVRFGSKADMCSAKRHVRFTPEGGHVRVALGHFIRSRRPIYSNRARIAVSGKCFGLITSLLKFSEKVSEPGGHGSLKGVLFTEALPDCVLNIG